MRLTARDIQVLQEATKDLPPQIYAEVQTDVLNRMLREKTLRGRLALWCVVSLTCAALSFAFVVVTAYQEKYVLLLMNMATGLLNLAASWHSWKKWRT